jgi:hypothetical protein
MVDDRFCRGAVDCLFAPLDQFWSGQFDLSLGVRLQRLACVRGLPCAFFSSDTCKLQHDALLNSGRLFAI